MKIMHEVSTITLENFDKVPIPPTPIAHPVKQCTGSLIKREE